MQWVALLPSVLRGSRGETRNALWRCSTATRRTLSPGCSTPPRANLCIYNALLRFGSFKQGSISERLADPQGFRPSDNSVPAPKAPVQNPSAIARPRASDLMYVRQASFRGLSQLSGSSPFKRQASLRLDELPSNLARWEEKVLGEIIKQVLILQERFGEDRKYYFCCFLSNI